MDAHREDEKIQTTSLLPIVLCDLDEIRSPHSYLTGKDKTIEYLIQGSRENQTLCSWNTAKTSATDEFLPKRDVNQLDDVQRETGTQIE